jgi:hypothetical protein
MGTKISDLTQLTAGALADGDELAIVDVSDTPPSSGTTKRITKADLVDTQGLKDYADNGDTNTLTAAEAYTDGPITVTTKTADWTLAAAHAGACVLVNSASNTAGTIPSGVFAGGNQTIVKQVDVGTATFVAGGGMTAHFTFGTAISVLYGTAEIFFLSSSECIVSCD